MLTYITSPQRDEIFAASLIRLTMAAPEQGVTTTLVKASQDPSPRVRAAAGEALSVRPGQESFQAMVSAAGDSYRLVRQGRSLAGPVSLVRSYRNGTSTGTKGYG